MTVDELVKELQAKGAGDGTVFASTPHGTYTFNIDSVLAVLRTGSVALRLDPIEQTA